MSARIDTALTDDERFALDEFLAICVWEPFGQGIEDTGNESLEASAERLLRLARLRRIVESGGDPVAELAPWRGEIAERRDEMPASVEYERRMIEKATTGDPDYLLDGNIDYTLEQGNRLIAEYERTFAGLGSLLIRIDAVVPAGLAGAVPESTA